MDRNIIANIVNEQKIAVVRASIHGGLDRLTKTNCGITFPDTPVIGTSGIESSSNLPVNSRTLDSSSTHAITSGNQMSDIATSSGGAVKTINFGSSPSAEQEVKGTMNELISSTKIRIFYDGNDCKDGIEYSFSTGFPTDWLEIWSTYSFTIIGTVTK